MFDVQYDSVLDTIILSVRGHLAPDQVGALSAAVDAATLEASARSGMFDVIVESLEFPVQAHEVAELLTHVMTLGMARTGGRAAVVVGSHLNRLQAERTLVHPRLRVFLSLDEAQAWLSGPRPVLKTRQAI